MKPEYIILHHSLTTDNKLASWNAIRNYHKSWAYNGNIVSENVALNLLSQGIGNIKRPWNDIGYHFGIELINVEYEILFGRMPIIDGAHCKEKRMNQKSIGICFVGNYDLIEPPQRMLEKGINLIKWLIEIYNIKIENVMGHRDFTNKTCPGKLFDLDKFRFNLRIE